ncbi:MAG: hypothetical protein JY451_00760 [Erythrobacter sp.]|nr:MAG: hypothetical protein JY451_00760 [Erythrobacter sp.]
MRTIGTGLAAALLLAGCGGSDSGTIETEDGTVEYDADQSGDEAQIRFTDKDGNETVINSGTDVAASLPDGFTVYPGAQVASSSVMSGADGQGSMTVMTSSDSPEEMVAHYRQQAEAAGFVIEMEMTTNDTMMIGGEGPDGQAFSFNASRSGEESSGMLMVGRN